MKKITKTKTAAETIIYWVRHGQVACPPDFLYGCLPGYHLSATGRQQAKRAAKFFSQIKVDKIYCSPLERTVETAEIIGRAVNIKPIKNSLLKEWDHPWGGWFIEEIEAYDRENWRRHALKPTSQKNGEPAVQVAKRMIRFLQKILSAQAGKTIIIVSHGDPIRYGLLGWQKENLDAAPSLPIETGSFYRLVLNGKLKGQELSYWENEHLDKPVAVLKF
jgi:broad specificity phosphatase PhoE